jgi:ribosomal protein S18 acetylase RimI-like enzyme
MQKPAFDLRPASTHDALTISALATQVFLDTYACDGVPRHLALEAMTEYSVEAFTARLKETERKFVLAETGGALIGFAEVLVLPQGSPTGGISGAQLVRLYVQPQAQGSGAGKALIGAAESLVAAQSLKALWLTAWEHNSRALAFYARRGYADVGPSTYTAMGATYGTRVLAKTW